MKAMDGGQMAADPVSLRRSLRARAAPIANMEIGRGDAGNLLIGLATIWLPLILLAMYVDAPQNHGPEAATIQVIIGIIGTIALYGKLFGELFNGVEGRVREIEKREAAVDKRVRAVEEREAALAEGMKEVREWQAAMEERVKAVEKNAGGEGWSWEKARKCFDD